MAGVALWFDDTVEVYFRNMEAFFYYFMIFILRIVYYFFNILFFG